MELEKTLQAFMRNIVSSVGLRLTHANISILLGNTHALHQDARAVEGYCSDDLAFFASNEICEQRLPSTRLCLDVANLEKHSKRLCAVLFHCIRRAKPDAMFIRR
jgi:hypothetical protein